MVVSGENEHAAVFRCSGGIGVLEYVAAPVHARPLAVPQGKHAVVFRVRVQIDLLRAPDRRRGEILVHAGLKADVEFLEMRFRAP